jgi:predicted adenylyl cyclase CyaB
MPSNIEIKARNEDFEKTREQAEKLAGSSAVLLFQEDTFFQSPKGRLKLRVINGKEAELIYYERPDEDGPRLSQYQLCRTQDGEGLKALLGKVFGIRGVVRKRRWLCLWGQTRIHLDEVEGLGTFLELECVLSPDQTPREGEAIVRQIASRLGVCERDLLSQAYIDLLPTPRSG